MISIRKWTVVWLVALVVLAVGCASTSSLANKVTFGLIGEAEDPVDAERRAEAREAKRAANEEAAAEKRARNEERSLLNRATFGLAGGASAEEKEQRAAEKQAERDAEEQRRADRQAAKLERDQLNREAKAQRASEKQARKEEKSERSLLNRATFGLAGTETQEERLAQEAKVVEKREEEEVRNAERRAQKDSEREANSERSLLNRATFGLAGSESEAEREERDVAEAAKRAERDAEKEQKRADNAERSRLNRLTLGMAGTETAEERAEKEAEDRVRREADAERKAEREIEKEAEREENAERSRLNRLTLGVAGTATEEERLTKEAEDVAEREAVVQRKSERDAQKEIERAENAERSLVNRATFGLAGTATEEERQEKDAKEAVAREEKRVAALAKSEEDANKTWLNRRTYGVLGEDYNDDALVAMAESDPDSLTPRQLEKAGERKQSIADHQARQNVQNFADPEARKLASYPFHTEVINRVTPKGNALSTATTETYSRADYGIADVGDVRIAVRGQTFKGDARRSRLIVASSDRGLATGSLGVGNQQLAYVYERGTTTVTFGAIEFTLVDSMLNVGGVTVPVGQGRKLVVLDGNGTAQSYDID